MALLFYLNDILVDPPINAIDLQTSIKRDDSVNGITVTQDIELTWNKNNAYDPTYQSGYDILYNAFELGTCDEIELKIYDNPDNNVSFYIFKGVIKVPSISIDYHRILAITTIQDNSFYAYINNNKNIEFNLNATISKNKVAISPTQVYEVQFFNTTNGNFYSTPRKGFRVVDVFDFLIKAISDNKLSFRSDYLSSEPQIFIFDGKALIDYTNDPNIIISFETLFNEINKIYKIFFWIDNTDLDNPVVRIEDESRYFGGVNNISFNDVKNLKGSIDTSNLYSSVNVGATNNPDGNATTTGVFTFPTFTSYIGWSEETYTPIGQCNLDNELDLVSEFHITTNDIANQVNGALTINLDEYFLVECENIDTTLFTADAKRYTPWIPGTNPNYRWYNQFTNNPSKLNTHSSSYFTALTNTLVPGGLGFQAGISTVIDVANPGLLYQANINGYFKDPLLFTNETANGNYDAAGYYFNTLSYYEVSQDGEYCFSTEVDVEATGIRTYITDPNNLYFVQFGNVVTSPNGSLPPGQYYGNWASVFDVQAFIDVFTDNTFTTLITSVPSSITRVPYNNVPYTISANTIQNLVTGNTVRIRLKTTTKFVATSNILTNLLASVPYTTPSILQTEGTEYLVPSMSIGYSTNIGIFSLNPRLYAKPSSIFNCLCSPDNDGIIVNPGDNAYFKYKFYEFSYDLSITDFLSIKQNPVGLFNFEKDNVVRSGWIQEMVHNDWTGLTSIKLIAKNASN